MLCVGACRHAQKDVEAVPVHFVFSALRYWCRFATENFVKVSYCHQQALISAVLESLSRFQARKLNMAEKYDLARNGVATTKSAKARENRLTMYTTSRTAQQDDSRRVRRHNTVQHVYVYIAIKKSGGRSSVIPTCRITLCWVWKSAENSSLLIILLKNTNEKRGIRNN